VTSIITNGLLIQSEISLKIGQHMMKCQFFWGHTVGLRILYCSAGYIEWTGYCFKTYNMENTNTTNI